MAALFTESFDTGPAGAALTNANTGFGTITAGPVFANSPAPVAGGFAAYASVGATSGNRIMQKQITAATLLYARFYLYLSAAPSTVMYVEGCTNASGAIANIRVNTDLTVTVRSGTTAVYTSPAIPIGQWVRVEHRVDTAAGQQQLQLFWGAALNGATPTVDSGAQTAVSGTGTTTWSTGITVATTNNALYLDEVQLATDTWVGPAPNAAATNIPPVANAGPDQAGVEPWSTVTLTGADSDTDGTVTARAWTQTAGPAVILAGATTASATFEAPATVAGTTLTMAYTATDNSGATATDTVSVTVLPVTERAVIGGVEVPMRVLTVASGITPPAPPAFPADIPGLGWRMEGSSLGAVGTAVAAWPDLAGLVPDFVQATAAMQPTVVAGPNNTKGAYFDGTRGLTGSGAALSVARNVNGLTVFAVATLDTITANTTREILHINRGGSSTSNAGRNGIQTMGSGSNTGNGASWSDGAIGMSIRRLDADSVWNTGGTTAPTGTPFLATGVTDYTGGTASVYLNGGQAAATTLPSAGTTSDTDSRTIGIGQRGDMTNFNPHLGNLFALIVYKRALTDTERIRVRDYLTATYGITT